MSDGIEDLLKYSIAGSQKSNQEEVLMQLEDLTDKFFWDLNDDGEFTEDSYGGEIEKGFHPSQICGIKCARKLVYGWLDAPYDKANTDIEPTLRRIFDNGSDLHDRWQRYFTIMSIKYPEKIKLVGSWRCKGCGFLYGPDVEVEYPKDICCPECKSKRWKYAEFRLRKEDLRITGKRDGKLLLFLDGEWKPFFLEIKSINMFAFNKLYTAKSEHKKQFSFYMFCDGLKEGIFLYECKNTQNIKMFYHKYDSGDIHEEISALQIANSCIDKEQLPKRLSTYPQEDTCKTCIYKVICKNDEDDEVDKLYKDLNELSKRC